MRKLDVIVAILVVIGALNWGLIGLFEFNLVAKIFGGLSIISRIVYILVGLSGLYQIVFLKQIQKRWNVK